MLAFNVITAAPDDANAELNLLAVGILRPVGAVLLSTNVFDANFVLSMTEIASIRGLSYGGAGTDAGGV
jgi:hypothetical protein